MNADTMISGSLRICVLGVHTSDSRWILRHNSMPNGGCIGRRMFALEPKRFLPLVALSGDIGETSP